jgi:hypothetical protein
MNNKKVLLYGNCQICICVYKYIQKIYNNITIWWSFNLIENNEEINYEILKNIDIFIYQPINESFGEYSIKNMIQYLKNSCIQISVPFIFLNCFYPLTNKAIAITLDGVIDTRDDKYKNIILNQDIIIELSKKHSEEEIIELFKNNKIDFNFKKMFDENINRIRDKEKECNIKIIDFILENYQHHQLVSWHLHPTGILVYYYVKQIFKILNFDEPEYIDNLFNEPDVTWLYTESSIIFYDFKFNINKDIIRTNDHYIDLIKQIIKNIK